MATNIPNYDDEIMLLTVAPKTYDLTITTQDKSCATWISMGEASTYDFASGPIKVNFVDKSNRIVYIGWAKIGSAFKKNILGVTIKSGNDISDCLTDDSSNHRSILNLNNYKDVKEIIINFVNFSSLTVKSTVTFEVRNMRSGKLIENNSPITFAAGGQPVTLRDGKGTTTIAIEPPAGTQVSTVSFGISDFNATSLPGYFCSYINKISEWNYSKQSGTIVVNPGSVTVPMFFDETGWSDIYYHTLAPKVYLPDNYSHNQAKVAYNKFSEAFPPLPSGNDNYFLNKEGSNAYAFLNKNWPDNWTMINGDKTFNAAFESDKPFRITSDSNGNNIIATTNIGTKYTATWKVVPDTNTPYYDGGDPVAYFVTKPYEYSFNIFTKNPFKVNTKQFTVKYTDSDHSNLTTAFVDLSTSNSSTIKLTNMLSKEIDFNINNIYNDSYFCAYIDHLHVRHFWYDEHGIFNASKETNSVFNSDNKGTNTYFIMCSKYDNTINPHISAPTVQNVSDVIKLTYLYTDTTTINVDNKYQYNTVRPKQDINISENTSLGKWARYGFNVGGQDYTLKFTTKESTEYTKDYDLFLFNSSVSPASVNKNVREYSFKSLPTNNYEYFTGSPKFVIYPKPHIKYIVDKSVFDNGVHLKVNLSSNNITESPEIIRKPDCTGNVEYTTDISCTVKQDIQQQVMLVGSTLKPCELKVEWTKHDTVEEKDNKTFKSPSLYIPIINSSNISMPNTWKNVGVTYLFSMKVEEPTPAPSVKERFGLQIITESVGNKELNYTLNIADDRFNFTGINNKDDINEISENKQNYNSTIGTVSGNVLLINNTTDIPSTINKLDFNLYLSDTSYYVVNPNISVKFDRGTGDKYDNGGILDLSDYIKENISYRGKNQIKLEPIDVDYNITMNVVDANNNQITSYVTTVQKNAAQATIVDMADEYSTKNYNLVVKEISSTIGGKKVNLPRYKFNLVSGEEPISYLKNKPISFNNVTNSNVEIDFIRNEFDYPIQPPYTCILPAGVNSNIYFNTYTNIYSLSSKSNVNFHAKLQFYDCTFIDVNSENYAATDIPKSDSGSPLKSIYIANINQ